MSTVPTLRTWVAGEVVTAAEMNANVRDPLNWLLSTKALFSAVQTIAQSIANTTWTSITFTTEILDRDNGHSNSTNTSRYVAATPGYYRVTGNGAVVANSGPVLAAIAKNGTRVNGSSTLSTANAVTSNAAAGALAPWVQLNGTTDYVELQVYQGSGGSANTSLTELSCALTVEWAGN